MARCGIRSAFFNRSTNTIKFVDNISDSNTVFEFSLCFIKYSNSKEYLFVSTISNLMIDKILSLFSLSKNVKIRHPYLRNIKGKTFFNSIEFSDKNDEIKFLILFGEYIKNNKVDF